jgi:hypothetical protein
MSPVIDRWICTECGFIGEEDDFDRVQDPKIINNFWCVCPKCRTPESVAMVCDEPGCDKESDNGWSDGVGGYRRTCWDHSKLNPKNTKEK